MALQPTPGLLAGCWLLLLLLVVSLWWMLEIGVKTETGNTHTATAK